MPLHDRERTVNSEPPLVLTPGPFDQQIVRKTAYGPLGRAQRPLRTGLLRGGKKAQACLGELPSVPPTFP